MWPSNKIGSYLKEMRKKQWIDSVSNGIIKSTDVGQVVLYNSRMENQCRRIIKTYQQLRNLRISSLERRLNYGNRIHG